jgi:catechol 2,3-dioxygenase-like lactoylglutathione lyase family enzyme
MLLSIHPKLPMRIKKVTVDFYVTQLGCKVVGAGDYPEYLMLVKDQIELHFFLFPDLDPSINDGQVYIRTNQIRELYDELIGRGVTIHPNGGLGLRPWGQYEFSLLDPDNNLLTFGQTA